MLTRRRHHLTVSLGHMAILKEVVMEDGMTVTVRICISSLIYTNLESPLQFGSLVSAENLGARWTDHEQNTNCRDDKPPKFLFYLVACHLDIVKRD